ncbi:MAG: ABC-2 family transporter protein [Candidatus Levybacteria bacterium]|nr:ABC-2 family transporter protein [Candidatus Levybacteria bacterium]
MLTKPLSPLYRSLFGGSDVLDLLTIFPLLVFLFYVVSKIDGVTVIGILLYILLVVNALLIALAFHIFVLGLGIITTEVDNAIWIFREITALGKVPVSVYREPVSWILTFILPVAAMITFPAQALMGILSWQGVVISFLFSSILLHLSLRTWHFALKQYASASS